MPGERARSTTASVDRGQSSVIGVVLIVGLTLLGVTGIMLFGSTAIGDATTRSEIDAAEHAMTQMDSQFSLVALGSSERQGASVTMRSGTSLTVNGDRGWMNVTVYNRSDGSLEARIFNTTMGAVTYENGDTSIAYQGGGVWKKDASGGSTMVSPPEFHYRSHSGVDPTLTLPLVVVRGEGSISGEAVVESDETIPRYPLDDPDKQNPLERGEINITVHSEYYEAWGAFWEERTNGEVMYDHDRELVSIVLEIKTSEQGIQGGIVSGAASSTLEFQNKAESDSYNSSAGNYSSTRAEQTSIISAGNVRLQNQAKLWGNLVAGGSVELSNKANITGNVTYGGTLSNGGEIGGWTKGGGEVSIPDSVDWLIEEKREAFETSPDPSPAINGNDQLQGCDSECTLDEGQYILEEIRLDADDELVLDTSSGDVEVVVRDRVEVQGDGKIRVTGDGTAKFYLEENLEIKNQGNVTVPEQRSPGLLFFMKPDAEATIQNNGRLVGVIYGPGGGPHDGVDISMDNQAEIYGGVVGEVDEVKNGIGLHFDEGLVNIDVLEGTGEGKPPVTYMHVTENRVNVSSR